MAALKLLASGASRWLAPLGGGRVAARYYQTENPDLMRLETSSAKTLMDIGTRRIFSSDHDIFRQSVRKFFQEAVAPHHAEMYVNCSGPGFSMHSGIVIHALHSQLWFKRADQEIHSRDDSREMYWCNSYDEALGCKVT